MVVVLRAILFMCGLKMASLGRGDGSASILRATGLLTAFPDNSRPDRRLTTFFGCIQRCKVTSLTKVDLMSLLVVVSGREYLLWDQTRSNNILFISWLNLRKSRLSSYFILLLRKEVVIFDFRSRINLLAGEVTLFFPVAVRSCHLVWLGLDGTTDLVHA